jgi:hypothetical protein
MIDVLHILPEFDSAIASALCERNQTTISTYENTDRIDDDGKLQL